MCKVTIKLFSKRTHWGKVKFPSQINMIEVNTYSALHLSIHTSVFLLEDVLFQFTETLWLWSFDSKRKIDSFCLNNLDPFLN